MEFKALFCRIRSHIKGYVLYQKYISSSIGVKSILMSFTLSLTFVTKHVTLSVECIYHGSDSYRLSTQKKRQFGKLCYKQF